MKNFLSTWTSSMKCISNGTTHVIHITIEIQKKKTEKARK